LARVDVVMPQMGESIAEGTLSRWLKKVGDSVKRDEPMFEISTDKVDAEIPAPSSGVLVEVLVTEGQTVPVQAVVARLETDASVAATVGAAPVDGAAAGDGGGARATATTVGGPPPTSESKAPPAPARHPSNATPVDSPPAAPAAPATTPGSFEERVRTRSSPLVRKIAAEHGIELTNLRGSGIAGRVTKRDIVEYIESGAAATAPGASMHAPAGVEQHGPLPQPWPGDVVEPMSKIRRLTADHMVAARRTAAHVTTLFEVDLTRVAKLRAKLRAEFEAQSGQKLTYLPFIIQAVVSGLQKFPVINAAVRGTEIIYRKQYNIGIAVALDWGLIVPVIRHAENLSLAGLTRAANDLANRARAKKLSPEEVQDATFTITNPGVFGSLTGTPIIPMPTVAILCLGAIEKRPKVIEGPDGDDVLAIRTCAFFSLSFDHRIIDGADADRFMGYVKQQLETIVESTA
jgi:pyruvate dehydrogenase E2 component (dihydrolipoamide acetyltransferase)